MSKSKKINYAHDIAVIVCIRYFASIGFKELPPRFWCDPRFSRDYRLQIMKANALLKQYSGPAIIAALNSKQCNKIYSLGAKWLDPVCAQEQRKLESEERKMQEAIDKYLEWEKSQETIKAIPVTPKAEKPEVKTDSLFDKLD